MRADPKYYSAEVIAAAYTPPSKRERLENLLLLGLIVFACLVAAFI